MLQTPLSTLQIMHHLEPLLVDDSHVSGISLMKAESYVFASPPSSQSPPLPLKKNKIKAISFEMF